MRVIFSRKGYDSAYGEYPSVIFPDRRMVSFPIPVVDEEGIHSSQMSIPKDSSVMAGGGLDAVFRDLNHRVPDSNHHLDPDLGGLDVAGCRSPCAGTFGQAAAALGHLNNQRVGVGDVFVFFGTFRETEYLNGRLTYRQRAPEIHAMFGYLLVDEVFKVDPSAEECSDLPSNIVSHPHWINRRRYGVNNCIYVGKNYGVFKYDENLRLTAPLPNVNKSVWRLPGFFNDVAITYHGESRRRVVDDALELRTVPIGQEFVLEATDEIKKWLIACGVNIG